MRATVIGHVEWVEFLRVESVPTPGEIVHASDAWAEAAGGGAVAAVQLANLGCETRFFTALGDDELGRRSQAELESRGVQLHVAWVREPQRRGGHVRGRRRRAHDHGDRGEAPAAWRRRLTPVGGAASLRLRLLHGRGRAGAGEGAACARSRRDRPRAADDQPSGRRARCARQQRDRRGRTLRTGRSRSTAQARRRHVGPARGLGSAGRAVRRCHASGPDRRCLRSRRLLRGRADVRARKRRGAARCPYLRRPLRRDRRDRPRTVRASAHGVYV